MGKILFYPIINTNAVHEHEVTKRGSLRIYCDYMMDCTFHGLKSLLGDDCVESIELPQWYNDVDKTKLYGNGFTIYGLIERKPVDNLDLDAKIKSKYFEQIIVPIHNNMFNNSENIETIKYLKSTGNIVKVICGNDDSTIDKSLLEHCILFKRELFEPPVANLLPISFAVPLEKFAKDITAKNNFISEEKPNHSGEAGWVIKDEKEYYRKYLHSFMAVTYKKGGWDSLRHYEIMMNGCIPLFTDLANCPRFTLTTLPKALLLKVLKEINNNTLPIEELYEISNLIYHYAKQVCTTERLAKYILEF